MSRTVYTALGALLYSAITREGDNQAEAAKKLGITEVTMSRYVRGLRLPQLDIMGRVCRTYDVRMDDVFEAIETDKEREERRHASDR